MCYTFFLYNLIYTLLNIHIANLRHKLLVTIQMIHSALDSLTYHREIVYTDNINEKNIYFFAFCVLTIPEI